MTHEQLTKIIIRYKENAQLAEALEAEQAEIREQLKLELAGRCTLYCAVRDHSEIVNRDFPPDDLVNQIFQRGQIEQRFAALDVQLPDLCGLAQQVIHVFSGYVHNLCCAVVAMTACHVAPPGQFNIQPGKCSFLIHCLTFRYNQSNRCCLRRPSL